MDPEQYVKYLPQFQVVVCLSCQYCLQSAEGAKLHFRNLHKEVKLQGRQAVASYVGSLTLKNPTDILLPCEPIAAIPELPVSKDGWKCNLCTYFCAQETMIKLHATNAHGRTIPGMVCVNVSNWIACYAPQKVQCLFKTGPGNRYFPVL
jgi:hypothetical protein